MDCTFVGLCGLNEEAQAAWLQAISSIIGIMIAIAVPYVLHLREQKERQSDQRRRARSAALIIDRDVSRIFYRLDDLEKHGNEIEESHKWVVYAREAIAIPLGLEEYIPDLHELGSAAGPVQDLLFTLREVEILLNTFEAHERYGPQAVPEWTGDWASIHNTLSLARRQARDATSQLQRLFKAP